MRMDYIFSHKGGTVVHKIKADSQVTLTYSNSVSSPTVATSATAKSPYSTITRSPREDGDGMTATTSQYADGVGPNLDPEHQMVEFYPDYSGRVFRFSNCISNQFALRPP